MIKIIRGEKETKKYIEDVKKIFEIYRVSKSMNLEDNFDDFKINKAMHQITNVGYPKNEHLKRTILYENILGDKTLSEIADENHYSVAHIYSVRQKIYKEFAAIFFEVIVI